MGPIASSAWRFLRHRAAWVAMLGLLFGVVLLASTIARQPPGAVDLFITHSIQRLSPTWLGQLLATVSLWGYQPTGVIGTLAGGLLVGRWLGWRSGLYLVGVTALQGGLVSLIKWAVARPRPGSDLVTVFDVVGGFSFPSGHVAFYTVFFGLLAWMAWRFGRGGWRASVIGLCLGMIAAVGPSRLSLGAHWASDVLAAYLLGGALLWLAVLGYERWLAAAPGPPGDLDEQPPVPGSDSASGPL